MKKDLAELVFILDRSGSMSGLEVSTIGGYNSFIKEQKQVEGQAYLTTVLFDCDYELLHNRVNIKDVGMLTGKDYYVRGMTALVDAIGTTIDNVGLKYLRTPVEQRPGKVIFVITTDGMENASSKYTLSQVKELIELHKKQHDWEFIFLGANIDALATARSYGIHADKAVDFLADDQGTEVIYKELSKNVKYSRMAETAEFRAEWKDEIEKDHKKRSKVKTN